MKHIGRVLGKRTLREMAGIALASAATFFYVPEVYAEMVTVKVMVVDASLALKPVPKHGFSVTPESGGDATSLTTSFEGSAQINLAPGSYVIQSQKALAFDSKEFQWKVPFTVASGAPALLELSNDNATVSGGGAPSKGGNAQEIYRQVAGGVITLESETGHGSAFLVSEDGLLLTNAHVVDGSRFLVARLSAKERYPAELVQVSEVEDIAVVRVHPEIAAKMKVLTLADDSAEQATVSVGEPIYAVGSPLNQEKIISQGIVGQIEPGALISDTMIDRGNSGGPMFDSAGKVIGINTFGDGQKISGTLRTWKAAQVLEEARAMLANTPQPTTTALPAYPEERYPADALKEIVLVQEFEPKDYVESTRPFVLFFLTPPAGIYYECKDSIEASEGRKKRRKFDKVNSKDTFDPTSDILGWREYVGSYKPLVTIRVEPKVGATFGSSLAAGLLSAKSLTRYKYKGDFDSIKLVRNGQEVPFVRVSRSLKKSLFSDVDGHMKDAAYVGEVEYLPEAFKPLASGESAYLEIKNEANPDKTVKVDLSNKLLERIWNDFAPMRG